MRLILLSLFPFLAAGFVAPLLRAAKTESVAPDPYQLATDAVKAATTAYREGDFEIFRDQMIVANQHRTDHPTYRYYLAAAFAKTNDAARAATVLSSIADSGLHVPAEVEEDFAAVASDSLIQAAYTQLRANLAPRGSVEVAHTLPARGGLWEGVTWDETENRLFLSDLHHGAIYQLTDHAELTLFARLPADGFGCGGMAIDAARGLLWVSSPALLEVNHFDAALSGQSRLLALALSDGRLVRRIEFPSDENAPCTVVDLTVAANGTVYAADSASPVIWRITPDHDKPAILARIDQPGSRHSLQGLALTSDERWLLVADYSTGFHAIALSGEPTVHFLSPPATLATALGIDGIALTGNQLVVVQNGVAPTRMLEITLELDPRGQRAPTLTGYRVIFSGQPSAPDPTLVTKTPEAFIAIGNAGWKHFGPQAEPDELNRTLTLIRLPFDS